MTRFPTIVTCHTLIPRINSGHELNRKLMGLRYLITLMFVTLLVQIPLRFMLILFVLRLHLVILILPCTLLSPLIWLRRSRGRPCLLSLVRLEASAPTSLIRQPSSG
jgi:hypothetical protein